MLRPRCTSACQRHNKDHRFQKHLLCRNKEWQGGSMPPLKACHLSPAYSAVWKSWQSCGHFAGDLRQCEDCLLGTDVQPRSASVRTKSLSLSHSGRAGQAAAARCCSAPNKAWGIYSSSFWFLGQEALLINKPVARGVCVQWGAGLKPVCTALSRVVAM